MISEFTMHSSDTECSCVEWRLQLAEWKNTERFFRKKFFTGHCFQNLYATEIILALKRRYFCTAFHSLQDFTFWIRSLWITAVPSNCQSFLHFSSLFCLHPAPGPFKNTLQAFWNFSKWLSTKFSISSAFFLFFLYFFTFCFAFFFSFLYFYAFIYLQVLSKIPFRPVGTLANNSLPNCHYFQLF